MYPLRRGMCQRHYLRWKKDNPNHSTKYATRGKGYNLEQTLQVKGWDVVDHEIPHAPGPCWEWRGSRFDNGYGRLSHQCQTHKAHRASHEVWVGPIPEGHVVRHKCDNPPCINPEHLETGTVAENHDDMWSRGRRPKNYKFSDAEVREMRNLAAAGMTLKEISAAKDCSISFVSRVVSGKRRQDAGGAIDDGRARTKLDWGKAAFIRDGAPHLSGKALAAMFGVDASVISNIRTGKSWVKK